MEERGGRGRDGVRESVRDFIDDQQMTEGRERARVREQERDQERQRERESECHIRRERVEIFFLEFTAAKGKEKLAA
jgi:hypothetical protein